MKLHEYQSRALLASYSVPVPKGEVTSDPEEAFRIAEAFGGKVVVKAQVLMGGRGKAGGIGLFEDARKASEFTAGLIGKRLVSPQNPIGMIVEKVLISEKVEIAEEYYIALLLDRTEQKDVLVLSARGGMDIEDIAVKEPEAIMKVPIDPKWGLWNYEIRHALKKAGINIKAHSQLVSLAENIYKMYREKDCTLIEINPCALTQDGKVVAVDAKVTIDDSALFRHPEFSRSEESAEDPIEAEAVRRGIAYVKLDGEIGVIGNGAGLVMLTLDEIAKTGKKAANFLDVGGGAQAERVRDCVELVLMDKGVKVLLINIFGGITRGDEVAKGVVQAIKELGVEIPIVARIEGTNAEEARAILSGAKITPARSVREAAEYAAKLVEAR
ncbi:MAG TPA: ADP-forming succinate--CoA ligase subunit beta [Fimbriimonadales bacterium]|nr:ADP-forming succinate--CoA ligase subunit beta [Fimbriimonadales bacterium]